MSSIAKSQIFEANCTPYLLKQQCCVFWIIILMPIIIRTRHMEMDDPDRQNVADLTGSGSTTLEKSEKYYRMISLRKVKSYVRGDGATKSEQ
jgi:hypothetical protein